MNTDEFELTDDYLQVYETYQATLKVVETHLATLAIAKGILKTLAREQEVVYLTVDGERVLKVDTAYPNRVDLTALRAYDPRLVDRFTVVAPEPVVSIRYVGKR